jgi:hypothetical protein
MQNCLCIWAINYKEDLLNKINFSVEGDLIIDAKGQSIFIQNDDNINIGNNAQLFLKNGNLDIFSSSSIKFGINSQLTLQNIKICLKSAELNILNGSINISGKCKIFAQQESVFNLNTSGKFIINSASTLVLGPQITMKYDIASLKNESNIEKKQHFNLQSSSSVLILKQAKIITNKHGLHFDVGKIFIQDNVNFSSIATSSDNDELSSWFIGQHCFVKIGKNSILSCDIKINSQ